MFILHLKYLQLATSTSSSISRGREMYTRELSGKSSWCLVQTMLLSCGGGRNMPPLHPHATRRAHLALVQCCAAWSRHRATFRTLKYPSGLLERVPCSRLVRLRTLEPAAVGAWLRARFRLKRCFLSSANTVQRRFESEGSVPRGRAFPLESDLVGVCSPKSRQAVLLTMSVPVLSWRSAVAAEQLERAF